MNKKEMITNGEDVSLDEGKIIVLNGVSVADELEKKGPEAEQNPETEQATLEPEKKEEEPAPTEVASEPAEEVVPQETPVQIPISVPEETPEIPTAPIDLTGIITPDTPEVNDATSDTTIYPQFPSEQENVAPISFGGNEETVINTKESPFGNSFVGSFDKTTNGFGESDSLANNNFVMNQEPENTFSDNSNLFNNIYNMDSKQATVVTAQDAINAKKANIEAYEKLYDSGPGMQIRVLREFAEEASKWIEAVAKNGFVSGEMHDMAKRILNNYRGLKTEEDAFQDDNSNFSYNDNGTFQPNDIENRNSFVA